MYTLTFRYLTAEGEEKQVLVTVDNIDKTAPTISSVTENPTQWTKGKCNIKSKC